MVVVEDDKHMLDEDEEDNQVVVEYTRVGWQFPNDVAVADVQRYYCDVVEIQVVFQAKMIQKELKVVANVHYWHYYCCWMMD